MRRRPSRFCARLVGVVSPDDVIAQRLRTQRLTSQPLTDPTDVVRLLTCVQAQDAPLARFSVGMRSAQTGDAVVRLAINEGRILRTHILRPTWHFVAAEDLRWILALTSARVESSMAARHRQLGFDPARIDRGLASLQTVLTRRHLTRRAIASQLLEAGDAWTGEQLGHLLMIGELRGLLCSGPLDGDSHTYGLVDELVAFTPRRDRTDAVRELTARFFAGHGPAAITDLTRWTRLTQAEVRMALEDLKSQLQAVTVAEGQLWFDPAADAPDGAHRRAFLLPVFDEAYLSYATLNLPRADGHPSASTPHAFAEAGGGVVVLDRHDVGWWRRRNTGRRVDVTLAIPTAVRTADRELIAAEVARLAAFTGRTPNVTFSQAG